MSIEVKRWTDDGVTWLCGAYDHGPMCRQCWPVNDNVREAIVTNIDKGLFEITGWKDAEPVLHVTAAGMRMAQEVAHDLASGGDEDS